MDSVMIFIIQQRHFMASLLPQTTTVSKHKQHSLKIDMTPMVDLGFLLITFFIFTATLSQPRITRLIMPKDGEPADVAASRSLTLLLAKEKVMVYEGRWEDAVSNRTLSESTYHLQDGIGNHIRQKQKTMTAREDLVVLIKPMPGALYNNVIAALDEMQINDVRKYAIVDASFEEMQVFKNQ